MKTLSILIKRNTKMFFKDKGMFFTSLITPAILLVLYATFLFNVYKDSFTANIPAGLTLADSFANALAGGQLVSSLLSVSCVTVPFCANFLMVQDKANGSIKDIRISPIKPSVLSVSYYFATLISSLIICLVALCLGLIYLGALGWYLSVADVLMLVFDVILLVFFGTALSSVINFFLNTQGQISAVGTVISAGYGFICGAYMPISSFGEGLQKILMFLPGTYATSMLRNHALNGVLGSMESDNYPLEFINSLKDTLDCNLYFFGTKVPVYAMLTFLAASVIALAGVYILLNSAKKSAKN
ncbi:MAG: ABC transporter permease [Clostridia bacterium]|nr:ABC transporter permease [Clostridia bacterium]